MSLDVENTLWANCVVANGSALGAVVYTGAETRSVMNNSQPRSKVGLLDIEINQLTKVLLGFVSYNMLLLFLFIYINYISASFLCCGWSCLCNDVFKRFQWSMVSLHVPICITILIHYTNQVSL